MRLLFIITDKSRSKVGGGRQKVLVFTVMKDEDLKIEETEQRTGSVVWTDTPVCMCDRGSWGRGGCGFGSTIRYT